MVVLTPAALGSPPDQHWLGGLYDNVVLAIVEGVASVELYPPHNSKIDEATVAVVSPTRRVYARRAPPLVELPARSPRFLARHDVLR